MIKRAMELARDRGLMMVPCPTDETLCRVYCPVCGWPNLPIFDVVVERYVKEPHGCHPCSWKRDHG